MKVIKRDGTVVDFDERKIVNAVKLAMSCTDQGISEEIASKVASRVKNKLGTKDTVDIEDIQDLVEKYLMDSSRKDAAKEYTLYREKRNIARQSKTRLMFEEIINTNSNDITRENANMNSDTPAGMMMKFASETTKPFVDNYLLSPEAKEAVKQNYIHIHDKDYYPTKSLTCLQHPLDRIFKNGFRAGHGELRPPKRIETAATQACVSMETIQNEMHGGQSIPAFDFYLAPFVRMAYVEEVNKIAKLFTKEDINWEDIRNIEIEDYIEQDLPEDTEERIIQEAINRTVDRVHQAMESFIHNMNNIHSRGGNQVVFSSINYGTDTSAEGRCIIRETLRATEAGVGNGATAIFPIHIWKVKTGVNYNPEDRNYDLFKYACKVTARRFFPNFVNLDTPFNYHPKWRADDPKRYENEVVTMGCRTRIFTDRFGEMTSIGRGNLSFTTINLPKLAIEAAIKADLLIKEGDSYVSVFGDEQLSSSEKERRSKKAIDFFWVSYENCIDIVAKQLDDRYQFQATAKAKQFPLLMSGMWKGSENLDPEDTIESVIKHGSLSIGYIGLAEALTALTGKHHGESEESQKLGLEIVSFLNEQCKKFSEMYDHNYTAFATPAEGLSGKFTKKDIEEYGKIVGVTDKDFYTNSNHIPVGFNISAKEKLTLEAPYHALTPAGNISYNEIDGDLVKNPEAIEDLVRIAHDLNVGYYSINHNQIRCENCNYESTSESSFGVDESGNYVCPKCGSSNVTHLARITGYLTTDVRKWNSGKKAEWHDRVTHSV